MSNQFRHISSELFIGLSLVSGAVGLALRGQGFGPETYLNPLALLMIPRLAPFALAALSAAFGVIYFVVEQRAGQPVSVTLTIVQMATLLLAAVGHVVLVRFWSDALAGSTPRSMPLWSAVLFPLAFLASLTAFGFNIMRGKPPITPVE